MVGKNNRLKQDLLRKINDFLDGLETEEGVVVRDVGKLSEFQNEMDDFFNVHGIAMLAWMVKAIDDLLKDAAAQFKEDGATYDDVKWIREMYGVKGDKVERKRNGQLTPLYALLSMAVIRQDISQKIQGAMIGDTSLKELRGAVYRGVGRKFNDFYEVNAVGVLFNSYNAATKFFAKEYGYTKFRYEGGLIADSRDFCIERDGLEFWMEDGESWNDLEWKGKIPGVDFFVQAGGFNCRHWLVYVK